MNQAMLAKHYWRIGQNPHSLISKTFKARYIPRCSIHDCTPKPHQSWFWRNIIDHKNSKLKEGRWLIGIGFGISLDHLAWFPCHAQHQNNPNIRSGTVADLIDSTSPPWKPSLVQSLYPYPLSYEILRTHISKTGTGPDKLVWIHSFFGDYNVKCAYNLLHSDTINSATNPNRHFNITLFGK